MKPCPLCGRPNENRVTACEHCAREMVPPVSLDATPREPPPLSWEDRVTKNVVDSGSGGLFDFLAAFFVSIATRVVAAIGGLFRSRR